MDEDAPSVDANLAEAIKINPRNGTITHAISAPDSAFGGPNGPQALAMTTSNFWGAGYTLRIGFMAGSEWQRSKVRQYAPLWGETANIYMKWDVTDDLDILIDFKEGDGSWS